MNNVVLRVTKEKKKLNLNYGIFPQGNFKLLHSLLHFSFQVIFSILRYFVHWFPGRVHPGGFRLQNGAI